ncbi:MAG: hypothetical protein AAGN66_30410, partial [Acidobacteriota bacterium]
MVPKSPDQAQKVVGLSALALVVIGPLLMVPPVFLFTPLDRTAWWAALGIGAVLGLVPVAWVLVLGQRGLLDLPQSVIGGGLLLLGTAGLGCGATLLLNGLLDRAPALPVEARAEEFRRECSDHRPQNSTTTVTTCRSYGSFSIPGDGARDLRGVELPEGTVL